MNLEKKKLLEYAINIQISPEVSTSELPSMNSVISVLTNIQKSYFNFLEIDFSKNPRFKALYDQDTGIFKIIERSMELLIVDARIGSFQAALAPNLQEINTLFKDEILDWKKQEFESFKTSVILPDFEDLDFIESLREKYTPAERNRIYNPIFSVTAEAKNYKVNIIDAQTERILRTLQPPSPSRKILITPKIGSKPEKTTKNVIAYIQLNIEGEKFELKKSNIKNIYDIEELEHDTYPFKSDVIKFEDHIIVLKKSIKCTVEYSEELYYISYPDFDIHVWGTSREEVEEAFNFTFWSLYENFASEDDKNLSEKAKHLKEKLNSIIDRVYHEAEEE